MNRGVDHQAVFFANVDRVEFGHQLSRAHAELSVTTLAYCLMGNHFHLLVRSPPGALSPAMQHLISVYTRHTNDRVGRDGPLFRGRFHSIPVETDAYLLQATRYIHRNPTDLPGVESPRDYRWSSYRSYLGLRRVPDFLDVQPLMGLMGGPRRVADFTEDDLAKPHRRQCDTADLRQLISCGIAIDELTHRGADAGRNRLARTILVLLADRCAEPALRRNMAIELAHPSDNAAAAAVRRARRRLAAEPTVGRVLEWVEGELGGVTLGV